MNKALILGYLGADPELRYTPSGQAVTELRVATSEKWTDKSGEKHERTEWHRVTVWGKTAENCCQYLAKGRQVLVEGKIQTRKWQDKEGKDRYTTEIVAQHVQFVGGQGKGNESRSARPASGGGKHREEAYDQSPPPDDRPEGGGGMPDDDIPF